MPLSKSSTCDRLALNVEAVNRALVKVSSHISNIYGIKNFRLELRGRHTTCTDLFKEFKDLTAGLLDSYSTRKRNPLKKFVDKRHRNRKFALTVASSLVSAKKLCPTACKCSADGMRDRHKEIMTSVSYQATRSERRKINKIVAELFPPGWDKNYKKYVYSASLSVGACVERSRSAGGAASYGWPGGRNEYIRQCLNADKAVDQSPVKFQIVHEKGKARGITIPGIHQQVLRPLHKMMYDKLSEREWLLRGDATCKKLQSLGICKSDEVYVSGDYKSATDNLSQDVADIILRRILMNADHVPAGIKDAAEKSLRCAIDYGDGVIVEQTRGQLMGSLLSFPLLCIQNYVGVRLCFSKAEVPDSHIRINGDDIILKCQRSRYGVWADTIKKMGLELSPGKTFLDRRFMTINSTYFYAGRSRITQLPVARLGMLDPSSGFDSSLGADHNYFVGPMGSYQKAASNEFRSVHAFRILRSGRSMTQEYPLGLGMVMKPYWCSRREIKREAYFFKYYDLREPLPVPPDGNNLQIPREFVKTNTVTENALGKTHAYIDTFQEACTQEKWNGFAPTNPAVRSEAEEKYVYSEQSLSGKRLKKYIYEMKRTGGQREYESWCRCEGEIRKKWHLYRGAIVSIRALRKTNHRQWYRHCQRRWDSRSADRDTYEWLIPFVDDWRGALVEVLRRGALENTPATNDNEPQQKQNVRFWLTD